jgi:tetratricopeptide (TPR) repeat protein
LHQRYNPLIGEGAELMKGLIAALGLASASATAVHAAEKPVIGPPPSWVKPVPLPAASTKTDETPVRILLSDQQVSLEPGRQTVYSEVALKILTPQGLAAGNISFPWRPETDVLTVHKLQIRRGEEIIDVLASGQTFTVLRREQNLESAMLDGVLTANIQPEGLQVGDIVDFAASVSSSDPTLKGHVEQMAGAWNGFQVGRAHLRILWPAALPVHIRQTASLPQLKPTKSGGSSVVEISLDDVQPIIPPKAAPPRYRIGRFVEATDYASWADVGALMAPLYSKAAIVPAQGPLHTELDRIRSLSSDAKIRAEAALTLVQDRVRYVAATMGAGAYVPADAETTWTRRYGDCKGKTALLLALLSALDIEAEPVAVSTVFGDGLDARLPMVGLFNHVLVRATVAGRSYWLDGTRRGDTSLDRLTVPNFGWGLPLVARDAALTRIVPPPLEVPTQDTSIRIDASAGISSPAPTRVETILRGDDAIATSDVLANLVGAPRDQALREYWKRQYDFIDVKSASAGFDTKAGELRLTMAGFAKMNWADNGYETDGTGVGYRADFTRDPGTDPDAPFAVAYPYFSRTLETILLPKGRGEFKVGTGVDVDQTAAGIQYRRHAKIAGDVFTVEKTERSIMPEFPAKDAPAAQATLRTLADHPATLREPFGYEATEHEIAAARADTPANAYEYGRRAGIFLGRGMREEALQDYSKAIELDPTDVWAWSNRALTKVETGDLASARSDLNKAETLDPTYVQIFIGRGMLADVEHRPKDAVTAYTKALQREPSNIYALERRSTAYAALGDGEHAAADRIAAADAAIAADPNAASPYLVRGNLMLDSRRLDDAIKDFDRAVALDPNSAVALANRAVGYAWKEDFKAATKDADAASSMDPKNALVLRAHGFVAQRIGNAPDAIRDYTAALQIEPSNGFALGHRAEVERAAGDNESALRDAAAALKQQPDWIDLYLLRANILRNLGRRDEALAEAAAISTANPNNSYAHVVAANIYNAFHMDAEAIRAYDRALALKPEPYIYLNRSLRRPKTDVAGRLTDLDAALKLDPKFSEAIAEKASMQADGGDLTGAIATYSAALEKSPNEVALLSGRGIAYARAGDLVRAEKDFAAARAKATEPGMLNALCWSKATAGVALESALAECNAALAKAPEIPNYLDSRGLVFLRLGRTDDAIADYNHALAKSPNMPSSMFGRAIAWSRKGDRAKADADTAAALKIDPDISTHFERYGMKL